MNPAIPNPKPVANLAALRTPCSSLQIHHAQCEMNFLYLDRLLPGFSCDQHIAIGVDLASGLVDQIDIRVVERSPFTALVSMRQAKPPWGGRGIELQVRVYLDARMAEVIGCPLAARLLVRYPYPNPRMLARDEKWQLNRLLGEWLSFCMVQGHAVEDVAVVIDC